MATSHEGDLILLNNARQLEYVEKRREELVERGYQVGSWKNRYKARFLTLSGKPFCQAINDLIDIYQEHLVLNRLPQDDESGADWLITIYDDYLE